MLFFKSSDLSVNDKKKLLYGTVIPRPVALVLTQNGEGLINVAPFSYFNMLSYDPPLISVSIQRNQGQMKDTARNILASQEASVHIVDERIVAEANKTAAPLKPDQSELERTNFSTIASELIETPGIAEAAAWYETTLYDHLVLRNEAGEETADLVILKVLAYHIAEDIYDSEKAYIIADALAPVSRLAGPSYAKLGEQFNLKRPIK